MNVEDNSGNENLKGAIPITDYGRWKNWEMLNISNTWVAC
jgi:hypothetical protein